MSASYDDWESDLSSIIEKTNQNLKLLRRIGEKRTDDVTSTRPTSVSVGNASDLRTAVHHQYAMEDAASSASYRPRVMSSASTSRKHATMGPAPTRHDYDSDDLHSMSRPMRRSTSTVSNGKTLKSSAAGGAGMIRVHEADMPSETPHYVLDEIKKSLEVTISSRSSVFEKKLGDMRTDFTVLTNETTTLSQRFNELRDAVMAKMSNVPGVLQSLQENTNAIARLEKHSSALLGWKVTLDQEVYELLSKMKNFTVMQDKMATLDHNLDSLATALKNRPRYDEKIEELRDKVATVERHQSSFVDIKAVEHLLSIRLPRELHELEGRMNQSIAFVSEKLESKIQSLEKSLQSQRAESMATLKSELVEGIQHVSANSLRKIDIVPLQNTQVQLKEDLSQLNGLLERQDKRIQDFKQASTQIREELVETRQELTKALHAQQSRVTGTLEEKIAQLSVMSKEKNVKVDQQMAVLSKKQKKVEENTKILHEDLVKMRQDVLHKQNVSHVVQQKENEKLRHRLARSVAELEALTLAKTDLECHYGKQEKQFQAKLKTLHTKLEENEKLKESERLELVQKIQEETKLMGIAQGKNALLEALLAKEKLQNAEKSDLIHKSRQEMNVVRQKMRSLEHEVEKKMHKLASDLHAKQLQVETLAKRLKKTEDEAAKLVESSKRDAKAHRRAKVTKEHELSIAKLKLKELENAAALLSQANSKNDETTHVSKRSLEAAEAKRQAMEQQLLDTQLHVDELIQEMEEMKQEFETATKLEKTRMDDEIALLSSEYEAKILTLNDGITDKDETMRHLRDTLVEKAEFDALDDELRGLKNEKISLLADVDRVRAEHSHTLIETESRVRLLYEKDMETMKDALEAKLAEINEARTGLDNCKANMSRLELQLKDQERSHADEMASLMEEIKDTRANVAACASDIMKLQAEKSQLEQELEETQYALDNAKVEAETKETGLSEKLAAQESALQRHLDDVSSHLADKEIELEESKRLDEANREKLVVMVSEQEEMECQLKTEIDSLSLALDHERENSKTREQELESNILALQSELDMMKIESEHAAVSYKSSLATEMGELARTLKDSQLREQRLQTRLAAVLNDLATTASSFDIETRIEIAGGDNDDDESLASKYLDHIRETQRGTITELENLQIDYEASMKQATEYAQSVQILDAQVKVYQSQIQDLEAVIANLQLELKAQYEESAKRSKDLENEIALLKKQKRDLELVVDSKSSECDEIQARFDKEIESKQDQVEHLRQDNSKLSTTIQNIRARMENIEISKTQELVAMSAQLTELGAQAAAYAAPTNGSTSVSGLDKDFYSNHHEIVRMAQDIRSLYVKLTKSVSILDWTDLRASVFEEEDRLERLRQEKRRETNKLESAEQEILLNADFLAAVLTVNGSEQDETGDDWLKTYANTTPAMVEKLKSLETRLQEAVAKSQQPALLPSELKKCSDRFDDPTDEDSDELQSELQQIEQFVRSDAVNPRIDLSESCESREFLEVDEEFEDEQSTEENSSSHQRFDESVDDSKRAELDEWQSSNAPVRDAPHQALTNAGRRIELIDPCTNLLSNVPAELLSTPFVPSPPRQRFKEQPKSLKEEQGDVEYALPDVIPREPLAPKDDWVRIDRDMLVADKQNSLPVAAMERRESENELSNSDEDDAEEHHATTFGDKVALKDHHFQADVKDEDIDASQSLGDRELDCEQRHGQLSTDADSDNLGRNEETSANRSHQMALNLSANIRDEDDDEDFGMERKRYVESEEEDHDIDSDFDEGLDENADAALKNIEKPVDAEHPSDAELSQVKVKQPSEVDASDDTVEQSQEDESVGLGEHMGVNETNFHEETSDFEESGAMESSFAKQEIDAAHTSDVQLKDGDDPHRQLTVSHTANEVVRGVDEESSEPGRDDRDADSMPKLPEGGEIKENKIDSVAVHEVTRDHQAARDEEESVSSEEEERALNFQRDVLDENDLIDSEEDEDATSDTEQSFLQADAQGVHKTVDRTSLSRQSYHMEEDSEEDDMDEVERMLLENSLETDEQHSELQRSSDADSRAQNDRVAESSFDDEQAERQSLNLESAHSGHDELPERNSKPLNYDHEDEDDELLEQSRESEELLSESRDLIDDSHDDISTDDAHNLKHNEETKADSHGEMPKVPISHSHTPPDENESDDEADRQDVSREGHSEASFDRNSVESALEGSSVTPQKTNEKSVTAESFPATDMAQGSRSALLKHMSYSRASMDDDDGLDKGEMLMREQAGRRARPVLSALSGSFSTIQRDEAGEGRSLGTARVEIDEDDELIDSESEDNDFAELSREFEDRKAIDDQFTEDRRSHENVSRGAAKGSQDLQVAEIAKLRDEESEEVDGSRSDLAIRHETASDIDEASDAEHDLNESVESNEDHIETCHSTSHVKYEEQSDDEEDEFGAPRNVSSLPPAPTRLQPQLLLVASGTRSSGAGTLKKALSAANRDFDEDEDEDLDDVERLMLEQSLGSRPGRTPAPSAVRTDSNHYAIEDSEDDDVEFGSRLSFPKQSHDGDDFEDHELESSMQDDHDESFDASHEADEMHYGHHAEIAKHTPALDNGAATHDMRLDARHNEPSRHHYEDEELGIDGESEDGDEVSTQRFPRGHGLSSGSPRNLHALESLRNANAIDIGRHVALEEDDDMDEVERLLLEQTSMKQSERHHSGAAKNAANQFDEEDEFDEASIDGLSEHDQRESARRVSDARYQASSHHSSARHDEEIDGPHITSDVDEQSIDASQDLQETSFDERESTKVRVVGAGVASTENSFDEASLTEFRHASKLTHNAQDRDNHEESGDVSESRHDEDSRFASDDEDEEFSTHLTKPESLLPSMNHHNLEPLRGKRLAGLGLGHGVMLEEDSEMDEVERLLLAQPSMKQQSGSKLSTAQQAETMKPTVADEFDDEDAEFGDDDFDGSMRADQERSLNDSSRDLHEFSGHNTIGNTSADNSFDDEELLEHKIKDHSKAHDHAESNSEEEDYKPSSVPIQSGHSRQTVQHSLAPLSKHSMGLGAGRRMVLEEDDDMDEVERLLLEQSSMKQPARMFPLKQQHRGAVNDSDDEFGEASIDDEPKRQSHRLSILTSDRTDGHGVDSRDDASEGDTDNASDVELSPASKRRSSFDAASQSSSSASSPSASTRIPILNGSNLTDRVATDAIPSMLQLSPLYASEKVVDSEIRQQLSTLDNDDGDNDGDDDGEDEYLEESFDLEESLQDEDEE